MEFLWNGMEFFSRENFRDWNFNVAKYFATSLKSFFASLSLSSFLVSFDIFAQPLSIQELPSRLAQKVCCLLLFQIQFAFHHFSSRHFLRPPNKFVQSVEGPSITSKGFLPLILMFFFKVLQYSNGLTFIFQHRFSIVNLQRNQVRELFEGGFLFLLTIVH